MEWVEVRGKSIDVAVEAAMRELGITDRDRIEVEVLQQPERGFLGIGAKDAIVKVKPRAERRERRRQRRGRGEKPRQDGRRGSEVPPRPAADRQQGPRDGASSRSGGGERVRNGGRPVRERRPEPTGEGVQGVEELTIDAQAAAVEAFLAGLVGAFGIEGDVSVSVAEDTIVATVSGPQTEAMVGPRGSVIEAAHEIVKTVLNRRVVEPARVRLDIGGYGERRRQALAMYAEQLVDQVLAEGGEITLEPMSSSDRKAVHDVVAAHLGVRSYSEGEPPQRYVVIARTEEVASEPEGSSEEE